MRDHRTLDYPVDGAQLFEGALKPFIRNLKTVLADLPPDEAGVRIHGIDALQRLLEADGGIGTIASSVLGENTKPVRAIFFNKSFATNWSLAWHQDRTICVKNRRSAPGFGPWTVKGGMHHVEPPFELLERMVTVRAHLDDVPVTNAPLLIAPGSHGRGRITLDEVDEVVRSCGKLACLADEGDIWLYSTPILHASEAASEPSNRRVLQIDFAAEELPSDLEWLGV